jgi:predicted nucleotide-binding protein
VLFEAGFFSSAKGKGRTLIIREEGTKFPADLGGDVYLALKDRKDISPVLTRLRKKLIDLGIL